MEDKIKIEDTMSVKGVDENIDIDKASAAAILNKVGEAIIKEHNIIKESLEKTTKDTEKVNEELKSIEAEIIDLQKEMEVHVKVVNLLESKIGDSCNEDAIKILASIRDDSLENLKDIKDGLEEHIKRVNEIKVTIQEIRKNETTLNIASDTLIQFGMKYGLIQEVEEK